MKRHPSVWHQSEVYKRRLHLIAFSLVLHPLHPLITPYPLRSRVRKRNLENVQPWQHASLFLAINKGAQISSVFVTWSTWQVARARTAVPLSQRAVT